MVTRFMFKIAPKVISGLEGSGKSSKVFEQLLDVATLEKPVLFGVKNYKLMSEQINNWSVRYNIPLNSFAICGFNSNYEPAREAYTNPNYPSVIPKNTRFVFTSQSLIQRNRHLQFMNGNTDNLVEYSHIVLDEFDFTSGIIPTLDYQLNNVSTEKEKLTNVLLDWVRKNYTNYDYSNIVYKLNTHSTGFTIAHWITNCQCDLTFLTSELLSTEILKAIGFQEEKYINNEIEKHFKDNCIVNVFGSDLICEEFIAEMNKAVGWNRLPYELIISDRILTYYQNNSYNSLEVDVINHSSIQGSNNYRDRKILTILTYIPKQCLLQIRDALKYFGIDYSFSQVESLFYRDRLCQAVGRTLGYRGGLETDLIIHQKLLDAIRGIDFPYKLIEKDVLNVLEDKEVILDKVRVKKEKRKERQKSSNKTIKDFSILDAYFELDAENELTYEEIQNYLKDKRITGVSGRILPISKLVNYFGVKTTYKRINGKLFRFIKGLNLKI